MFLNSIIIFSFFFLQNVLMHSLAFVSIILEAHRFGERIKNARVCFRKARITWTM